MAETFNFNTSVNTFNDVVGSVIINFDELEMTVFDEMGNELIEFQIGRNAKELKRFYNNLGELIREME